MRLNKYSDKAILSILSTSVWNT